MKTKIFTLLLTFVSVFAVNTKMNAQASSDYVATTSGDYNTAANWSISNGAGGYTGTASSAPTTAVNVWIPEGKVMTIAAAANAQNMNISGELNCGNFTVNLGTNASTTVGNLIITSTGKFRSSNATGGSVNSLNVYGNTITIDGQLGAAIETNYTGYNASTNPDGGGGFRVYCMALKANETTTVTVSGTGNINVARFYSSTQTTASAPQIIDINANINILNNNSSSVGAFGSIGNTGGSDRIFNVSAGKTVKFTGATPKSSLHRDAVTSSSYTSGDFIYNVFGTLDMGKGTIRLYTSYTSGNAKGTYLNVKNGGTLVVGDSIRLQMGQASGQTCGIFPEAGSTVKFGQATAATQFRNNIGAATAEFPTVFSNVILDNTIGLTYPSSFTVNDNLSFVNGNIFLGEKNLSIGNSGTISGASDSKHIVTNGTGALIQNVAAETSVLFPVGCSTIYYDPAVLKPTTTTVMSVNVDSVLTLAAAPGYLYNAREWNITSSVPSASLVKLTPSVLTTSGQIPVMGNLVSGAFVNENATLVNNTFEATFSNFASFVVGTRDVNTDLTINKGKLFVTSMGDQLFVNGTEAGQQLTIFNINGQVESQIIANNHQTSLNLKSGIYIVKVDNHIFKVLM